MKPLLPEAWHERQGLAELLHALGQDTGDVRFVGGFVRDSLLGHASADVDCATRFRPEEVINRIRSAGFKAVPTGIAHGTVTAVLPSGPIEITTLRRDVSTDGRRATVAYTDDWREDAARRDFTFNALSADPSSGEIYDYFGGLDDLSGGRVRFIGDPLTRIAEDHLRILRFFRFHARFGKGAPDPDALAACIARAKDLMTLSRERIADELLKLLALPAPSSTLEIIVSNGILRPVLPEIEADALERVHALEATEREAGVAPDPARRLAALLPPDPGIAVAIATRLRLSNNMRKRLGCAADRSTPTGAHELAYRFGRESALDRLLLQGRAAEAIEVQQWQAPTLPVGGRDLLSRGLKEGPQVAEVLQRIERRWIDEGFPDRARVDQIADEVLAAPSDGKERLQ